MAPVPEHPHGVFPPSGPQLHVPQPRRFLGPLLLPAILSHPGVSSATGGAYPRPPPRLRLVFPRVHHAPSSYLSSSFPPPFKSHHSLFKSSSSSLSFRSSSRSRPSFPGQRSGSRLSFPPPQPLLYPLQHANPCPQLRPSPPPAPPTCANMDNRLSHGTVGPASRSMLQARPACTKAYVYPGWLYPCGSRLAPHPSSADEADDAPPNPAHALPRSIHMHMHPHPLPRSIHKAQMHLPSTPRRLNSAMCPYLHMRQLSSTRSNIKYAAFLPGRRVGARRIRAPLAASIPPHTRTHTRRHRARLPLLPG